MKMFSKSRPKMATCNLEEESYAIKIQLKIKCRPTRWMNNTKTKMVLRKTTL